MIEGDSVRMMSQGQLVDIMQTVMEAIPDLTYEQAKLLCDNKGRLYQGVRKAISDTVFDINLEKTVA